MDCEEISRIWGSDGKSCLAIRISVHLISVHSYCNTAFGLGYWALFSLDACEIGKIDFQEEIDLRGFLED